MQLVLSPAFPFRFTFPLWLSLGAWLRAILLGLMVPMSVLSFLGDQYYLNGLKTKDIQNYKIAKKLFPFDLEILKGEAEADIQTQVVNLDTYNAIKDATFYDPYSVRLLSLQTQYAFLMNDNFTGWITFSKLKGLFSDTRTVKLLKEVVK